MDYPLRYSPQLDDLLYLTTEAEFSRRIGKRGALVTLLALKEIDSIAPALSSFEREILYAKLIHNPVIPYICSFNVRNLQLDLPILPDERVYEQLEEINVDEFNLTRILSMIKKDLIPHLYTLVLSISRPLVLDPIHLDALRSLTLENISDELHLLPKLDGLALKELILTGYAMEFQDRLPQYLKLRQCFVRDSRDLSGCEIMTLVDTNWRCNELSPGSFPSKSLTIESGTLSRQPPESLETLTLVDTEVSNCSLDHFPMLQTVRLDYRERSEINLVSSNSLKEVVLTVDTASVFLPESVRTLTIAKVMIQQLPPGLTSMELYEINIDHIQLLSTLPDTMRVLQLTKCSFTTDNDITADKIPPSLRTLKFIECSSARHIGIEPSRTLETLVVIGTYPRIRNIGDSRLTGKYLHARTNVLLMDIREFHLFCISQLSRRSFDSFEACYSDIFAGSRWKTIEELREYTMLLLKYPFRIPLIQKAEFARDVIMRGNLNAIIKIGDVSHKVSVLRNLVTSEGIPADRRLSTLVQGVRNLLI